MVYNEETIGKIRDILIGRGETIAAAESVTGGNLQAAFSAGLEASKYFQGGITVYNLGQKARHLNVDPILCSKENCVGPKIAGKMALEVCRLFSSDYGIGITGYASIVPECEKDGLFAYFALAYQGEIVKALKLIVNPKEPYEVQLEYTNQVFDKTLEYLLSS